MLPQAFAESNQGICLLVGKRPIVFRTFLLDSSPRSIAVGLPGFQSYCFDTQLCRIRYAWAGNFLEVKPDWKAQLGSDPATAIGTKYYVAPELFPLRVGNVDREPVVKFRGYSVINKIPEFTYEVDGIVVKEMTILAQGRNGLIRLFELGKVDQPVWFNGGKGSCVIINSSGIDVSADGWCRVSGRNPLRFEVTIHAP